MSKHVGEASAGNPPCPRNSSSSPWFAARTITTALWATEQEEVGMEMINGTTVILPHPHSAVVEAARGPIVLGPDETQQAQVVMVGVKWCIRRALQVQDRCAAFSPSLLVERSTSANPSRSHSEKT